ncbi:hypothetical protein D8Y23_06720 [Microbacterium enclense]|uniref:DUF6194 domain-containing protein n=1 Tax=Microbacterium enclense TaxID=993073 RepID=A0A3S3LFC5_9MICO|nr:DUF6194 family protein [Microbacterium enclense]RWR19937.1 hypothetical protein D8Y23_06720 [Microbacterium enclense]
MEMDEIVDIVSSFDGVLVVTPGEGSGSPELAWGDAFFYYAPDGVMPERTQPYGTIVTKNYPDDAESRLDDPDRFRVNIHIGRDRSPQIVDEGASPADPDVFVAHPLYGTAGWVSVVNPAESTSEQAISLLRDAHEAARARASRRAGSA